MRNRPTSPAVLALVMAGACGHPLSPADPREPWVDTTDDGDSGGAEDTADTGDIADTGADTDSEPTCEEARADTSLARVLPVAACASLLHEGEAGYLTPTALREGSMLASGRAVGSGRPAYHWRGPMGADSDIRDNSLRSWTVGQYPAGWGDGFAAGGAGGAGVLLHRFALDADEPILRYGEGVSGYAVWLSAGDFTGDGVEDLAFHPDSSEAWSGIAAVVILDGNARGDLAFGAEVALLQHVGAEGAQVTPIGDVDGDGIDDVGMHTYLVVDGLQFIQAQIFRGPLIGVHSAAAADAWFDDLEINASAGDFDGDGRADVVIKEPWTPNSEPHASFVVSPQGEGAYGGGDAMLTLQGEWFRAQAKGGGDLDGDGAADLLVEVNLPDLGVPDSVGTDGTWILTGPASGNVAPLADDPCPILLSRTYLSGPFQLDDDGLADLAFSAPTLSYEVNALLILPGSTIAEFF